MGIMENKMETKMETAMAVREILKPAPELNWLLPKIRCMA